MTTGAVGITTLIPFPGDTSVFEERLVFAENQIQKRLFGVDAAGLAQNVKVLVIFVHLPVGDRQAVGATGEPGFCQCSRLQFRAGVIRS